MQERNENNSRGCDISHYQGNINWVKVKSAGITFAIMKATEGTNFIDDTLERNITGAKENVLAVGIYHFCRASNAPQAAAEALHFCNVLDSIGGIQTLDIPPILDIETAVAQTKSEITAICKTWLTIVEERYKVKPIIYCDPSFAEDYLDDSLGEYPLWLACWSAGTPQDRCGWKQWTFLQYTDKGIIDGIDGSVDLDEYDGRIEELMVKLSVEDANKVIAVLSGIYTAGIGQDEVHRLANELRKASGQPVT